MGCEIYVCHVEAYYFAYFLAVAEVVGCRHPESVESVVALGAYVKHHLEVGTVESLRHACEVLVELVDLLLHVVAPFCREECVVDGAEFVFLAFDCASCFIDSVGVSLYFAFFPVEFGELSDDMVELL